MTSCSLAGKYRGFEGIYYFYIQERHLLTDTAGLFQALNFASFKASAAK